MPLNQTREDRSDALEMRQNDIQALAERALAVVAHKIGSRAAPSGKTRVRDLCNAMLHPNRVHQQLVLSRMVASGVSSTEIYEKVLPSVAHMLGERWVRDEISFVDVTQASQRLQEVIRILGAQYAKSGTAIPSAHTVYMCVPAFEDHSMGVFMAANQLRRMGVWVQLGIGVEIQDIVEAVSRHKFSMIGISAASYKSIAPLSGLIDNLRAELKRPTDIVVGGNVMNCGIDVMRETGADLVTTNVRDAARHCGIIRCVEGAMAS